jgi:MoaA/NifB/PqqE/SkfB family radical SAM enzyme
MMRKVIWYPSFRCNKHCPYCYEREYSPMEEKSGSEWIDQFLKLGTQWVDFYIEVSGGEPFLYPALKQVIQGISHAMSVSITTNLTFPEELKALKDSLTTVTVSYHPHSEDWTSFLAKVKDLQETIPAFTVNIVVYPDMFDHIEHIIPDLKLYGVPFHIEPYIYPDRPYTDEQKERLQQIVDDDRELGWHLYKGTRQCYAGANQQHWLPNGDVFACGTYLMLYMLGKTELKDGFYLGNLFDGTNYMQTDALECDYPCVVGCDLDFRRNDMND